MTRSILGSGVLIIAFALIGASCSGDQPAANANVSNTGDAAGNQAAVAINSSPANANSETAENGKYPESVAVEFMKSCEESGSPREFCTCMFDKVQQEYTFEEFSTIETKISAGEPPDDFVEFTGKARAECTK